MRTLKRSLRLADDLLEVLVLHVLLATPLRRKVVAATGLAAALSLYAFCGFIGAPAPKSDAPVPYGAPPFTSAWGNDSEHELARAVAERGFVRPDERARLERYLHAHREALDTTVDLARTAAPVRLARTPWFADLRKLSKALTARGALFASIGESDLAVRDWLAVVRLGYSVSWGSTTDGSTVLFLMIGTAIQRDATTALRAHADRLSPRQASLVLRELDRRHVEKAPIPAVLSNEAYLARVAVWEWAQSNRWNESIPAEPLRLWLPIGADARRDAAETICARITQAFDAATTRVLQGEPAAPPPSKDEFGLIEGVAGIFNSSTGVDLAARYILAMATPDLPAVFNRLQKLEHEIRKLESACATRL